MRAADRWPSEVRERCWQLGDDPKISAQKVADRLGAELGRKVPVTTVRRWLREVPDRGAAPTVDDLTERCLRLLEAEVRRLERSAAKLDIDKLNKVAATLKTLRPAQTSKAPKVKAQTLTELSEAQTTRS